MQKLSTSTSATMQLITFLTMALALELTEIKMVSSQDCGPTGLPHVQSILVDGFSELTFTYNTSFSNPLWCIGTTDVGRYSDSLKKIELINDQKTLVYRNPSPDDYYINGQMLFVLNNNLSPHHDCSVLSNVGEITFIPRDESQPITKNAVLFNITQVECPKLSAPQHGTVNRIVNGTLRAEYVCYPGYELRGNRTRKCILRSSNESEGEWTDHHQPICSPLLCVPIPRDSSLQSVQFSGNITSTSHGVPYRTIAEIFCTSDNVTHYRVCELDPSNKTRVRWNAEMPTCATATTELPTKNTGGPGITGGQNSTTGHTEIILAAGIPSLIFLVFISVLLFIIVTLCKKQTSRNVKLSGISFGNFEAGATGTLDKTPMETTKITTVQSRNNSLRSEISELESPSSNFNRSDSKRLTI